MEAIQLASLAGSLPQGWAAEVRAVAAPATLGDRDLMVIYRDLMVIHGSDDETVPVLDARAIADACPGADLRIIGGAGHYLRYDPERWPC